MREMNKDACDINLGIMKYSSAAMPQVSLGMSGPLIFTLIGHKC